MSFAINKNLVEKKEDGSIKSINIKAKSEKVFEYASVALPSNVNFGGFQDVDGVAIFGVKGAKLLVPSTALQDDRFDVNKYFIKLADDYTFPNISIDLGQTGHVLENGKNEHNFTQLKNVPLRIVEESFGNKQWLTFTITKKMQGTNYTNAQGEERTTIFIPGEDLYSGGRITINPKCITPVKHRNDLLKVSMHRDAKFIVTKSEIMSENVETGEKSYDTKVLGEDISAKEILRYFEKPEEPSTVVELQEVSPTTQDFEEEEYDELPF